MVTIRKIETNSELEKASCILAEAFCGDPLFQFVFNEKSRHNKSKQFFRFFLKSNTLFKSDIFLAIIEEEITAVCSFSYPQKNNQIPFKLTFLIDTCQLILQLGFSAFFKLNRYFRLIRETKKTDLYYLNFIGTSTKFRGKGLAKILIDYVHHIVESDSLHSEVGLDTENFKNLAYYQRFGYHLTEQKKLNNLTIYCMRKNFINH